MAALPSGSDSDYYQLGDFGTVGAALTALAGRTQGNVEDFYRVKVQGSAGWGGTSNKFFENLEAALGFPVAIVKAIVEAFGNIVVAGIETIQDIFDAASAFFGDQWQRIQDNFDSINDAWTAMFARDVIISEHTEAIADLNDVLAAQKVTYAYVGDLQDMVTVPRSQLITMGYAANKFTDVVNGFGIALVGTFRPNIPVYFPDCPFVSGVSPTGIGKVYYTPIVVDRNGTPGKMRWIVGADTAITSIDYYEMALCVYNPDTGNVEKVWGSGNIKDAEADTTTLAEVEIDMGLTGQSVTPGQIIFVAHQQTAPGLLQDPRPFAAAPQGDVGRPSSSFLDGACYVTSSYYTAGIPSSVSFATLDRENRFLPWGAISVSV